MGLSQCGGGGVLSGLCELLLVETWYLNCVLILCSRMQVLSGSNRSIGEIANISTPLFSDFVGGMMKAEGMAP